MSSSAKLTDQEVAVGRCGDHYNCQVSLMLRILAVKGVETQMQV